MGRRGKKLTMTEKNAAQAATQEIHEAFELSYAMDADDPANASDLSHFTNGWRACIMSQVRAEGVQAGDEPTKPRPPMCRISGVSEDLLRRVALAAVRATDERTIQAWAERFPEISDMGRLCDAWNDARASAPVAAQQFTPAFPNGALPATRFHELWERAGKTRNADYTMLENLTWQVGQFADLVAREVSAPVADERAVVQAAPGRQYHILKTDPEVFQAALSGAKTFEIRLNDRGYAVGDVLGLRETKHTGAEMRAGAPLVYTGRECQRFVSHVLTGYGLADGWCCLSFKLPHAGGESAPVAGEANTALNEWLDKTDFIQKRIACGELPVKYLGWHRADVMRDLIENAAPQASKAVCSCPTGDGSLRHPCAVHPPGEKDGGHESDQAPPQLPPQNRTEALHG